MRLAEKERKIIKKFKKMIEGRFPGEIINMLVFGLFYNLILNIKENNSFQFIEDIEQEVII